MYKKDKKIGAFILAALILLIYLCPLTSRASSADEPITVKVGYYQNEAFQDGGVDGSVKKGYAYEYYRKISEYTGWDYEYVYGDFVTIYQKLLSGEIDLVAGLAYTDDRSNLILYPEMPMGSERYGIVKHEFDETITTDVDTLNGKTIGVLNSAMLTVLREFLNEHNVLAHVVSFKDYEKLLGAFDRGQLDIVAAEIDGIYDRNHAQVLYSFGSSEYYLCVNKQRPDLLKQLNEAQALLFTDYPDYLSDLRSKYYTTSLAGHTFTSSEYEWLATNSELRVGYLNNFLPYSDTDANGNVTGMVSEIFSHLFKELSINSVTFSYTGYDNYEDMVQAVEDGLIDVAFPAGGGLYFSEEDGILLSEPVSSSLTDLVYNSSVHDSSLPEFAINKGNKLQYYYMMNNYPDATYKEYTSIDECLNAVDAGEVAYTSLNGLRTNALLRKEYDKLSFMQLPYKDDVCFGVKIGDNGLLKLLNRGIGILGADYTQSIAFRYSEKMNSYSIKDFLLQYSWLILLTALVILGFIVFLLTRDIRLNKKRLAEKEKAQAEVEKANHEKFVFVNKMSNYMRDPMRNLGSLIEVARNSNDEAEIKKYLGEMSSYSKELSSIVNNILNMSRMESEQDRLEDRNISMNLKGRRVLIVEDSMQNHMVTGMILKKFGFEIQVATDGKEAYDKLYAAPEGYFDAVVMDIDKNETEDLEDAVKIRTMANDGKAAVPIVVLTTEESEQLTAYMEESIVSAVIKKPYDIVSMAEIFSELFN